VYAFPNRRSSLFGGVLRRTSAIDRADIQKFVVGSVKKIRKLLSRSAGKTRAVLLRVGCIHVEGKRIINAACIFIGGSLE